MCGNLRSCSEANQGFLDLFVQQMVRRVNLTRRYRNSTLPLCKWTKHGRIALVIPGHEPPLDITIFMDIAKNPGPIAKASKTHSSCEDRSAINLHIVPQQLTPCSRNQLLAIRRSGRSVPSSYMLNSLKANSVLGGLEEVNGEFLEDTEFLFEFLHGQAHFFPRVMICGSEFFLFFHQLVVQAYPGFHLRA